MECTWVDKTSVGFEPGGIPDSGEKLLRQDISKEKTCPWGCEKPESEASLLTCILGVTVLGFSPLCPDVPLWVRGDGCGQRRPHP